MRFFWLWIQLTVFAFAFSDSSFAGARRKFGPETPVIPVKVAWTQIDTQNDKAFEKELPLYSLAMDLAIQSMDPKHLRGLDSESNEFKLILGVLRSIEKVLPSFSVLNRDVFSHHKHSYRKFSDLKVSLSANVEDGIKKNKVEQFLGEVEKIFVGCPLSQDSSNVGNLYETRQYRLNPEICGQKYAITELNRLGYSTLETVQKNYIGNTLEFLEIAFSSRSRVLKDPVKVLMDISKTPELSRLANLLSTGKEALSLGERPVKVELVEIGLPKGAQRVSTPISMTLLYSLGWEDCSSVCKNRHYWRVKVNALGFDYRKNKVNFLSEIQLESEHGNDLDYSHPEVDLALNHRW